MAGIAPASSAVALGAPATGLPYLAKITMDGRACSGALVDPWWVLSAASCFTGSGPATVSVGTATAHAAQLIPASSRDLMLIRLDAAMTGVLPVPLAGTQPGPGTKVQVAGFGRTESEWLPDVPHAAAFTIATATDATMSMTGDNGGDACKGDAGGPVTDGTGNLIGVVGASWQHRCLGETETRQGTTATRVDDLRDWLIGRMLGFAAYPAPHAVTLSWIDVASVHYASFRVYGSATGDPSTLLGTVAAAPFVQSGLQPGVSWRYRVVPVTAAGQDGPATEVVTTTTPGNKLRVGDVNGDHRADLVGVVGGALQADFGDGTGNVHLAWQGGTGWDAHGELDLGDVNGDGKADLVSVVGGALEYDFGDGTGNVHFGWRGGTGWDRRSQLELGDVNGDGKADLVTVDGTGLAVDFGDGTGNFHPAKKTGSGWEQVGQLSAADVDGDGKADLLGIADGKLRYYHGDGTGEFTAAGETAGWNGATKLGAGDVNGDGKADLYAVFNGALRAYTGDGHGTFTQVFEGGTGWDHFG
ncbi:FG-GAP-like repeat-containing protein [Amycolatopsis sp. cmx-4-61]|uniref:FG-GAP-like repeat-containing protein n=1 Tax=Amycolatopsis sp. cmx-4-61 TaxID=2790937 RepID=UPI00397E7822